VSQIGTLSLIGTFTLVIFLATTDHSKSLQASL